MKKLIYSAAALAMAFFAASCQQEMIEPAAQETAVTYTVELPGVYTKAIADGSNVDKLIYEVWKIDAADRTDVTTDLTTVGTRLYQKEITMVQEAGKAARANVTLNLVQDQEYTILFWAHNSKAVNGAPAYNTADLTAVTYAEGILNANETLANNESLAAFFAVDFVSEGDPRSKTVYLKRPFAQLNIGTFNTVESDEYTIDMQTSTVTVSSVPTVFNVATSEASGEAKDFEFVTGLVPNETLKVNDVVYEYAAMNYIFANHIAAGQSPATADVDFSINVNLIPTAVNAAQTTATIQHAIPNVPLSQNYRTNIVGNLLTSSTEYEVVIDPYFSDPEYVLGEEWSHAGNYKYTIHEAASAGALKAVLEHADEAAKAEATKAEGPVVTIDLAGDVVWETGAGIGSTPLLPEDSPISAVVINGNGKTFTATGSGVGKVRLANGGLLTFNNVKVVDLSVSYAENSWEYGYLEFGGNLAFNECEFVNAVMMSVETAEFVDCTFNSFDDNQYAVWVDNGSVSFEGCTFEGARGLKVHEAYGSEVATVVVDGCTFGPLTKKPGIALGTLNAETSVTIKNSTFDGCQAGDQSLYMYETDTDVTTFTFVTEKNTVVPSGDEVIEQGDGVVMVATAAGFVKAIEEAEAGDVIKVAGSVVLPTAVITKTAGALTIEGYTEDAEVAFSSTPGGADGGLNCYADEMDLLFKNITVVSPNTGSAYSGGFGRAKSVTFENCEYIGQYRAVNAYTKFIECTIDPQTSYIYTDYANIDFTGCTFNCSEGKGVQVYNDGNTTNTVINVTDCTFSAAKHGATWDGKPVTAIDINSNGEVFAVNITNTTATGFPEGLATASTLFNIKGGAEYVTVMVEGNKYIANGLYLDAEGNLYAYTAEALTQAAVYATEGTYNVFVTKDLEGDATLVQKPGVNLVINGQNKNFKGVIVVDGKSATYTTAGLTIKGLTFNAEAISADACIRLGDGTNATRYTCNVTVENCTFDVPGAVGVKSYTGGDKNLVITGCTATAKAHSLLQAKGIDGISVEGCTINSKNGMNFNNSTDVTINVCNADVKGYAARFGEGSADERAEAYKITNSTLKSACEDGDAVIILRGSAANATLNIENTTLEGTALIANNAQNAKVYIDGKEQKTAANQESLNSALTGSNEVTLAAGNYTLPSVANGDVTINGSKDVVVTINKPNYGGSDLTVNGVTIKGSGYATGVQHVNTVTYNDVKVVGEMCLYGEKVVFNECEFVLNNQYIWTYGAKEVEFINCTFNTNGKAILVYNEGAGANKVTVTGCTFNATAGAKAGAIANQNCAAIEIDNFQNSGVGVAHNVVASGNTVSDNFSGEWRIKNFVAGNPVTVNGNEYTQIAIDGKLMTIDSSKNVTVAE